MVKNVAKNCFDAKTLGKNVLLHSKLMKLFAMLHFIDGKIIVLPF